MRDLNEMFSVLVPAVQNNGGSVLKYTGDGMLAVYNVPLPVPGGDGGAQAAVDTALAMQNEMVDLNRRRQARSPGSPPLEIGIGIHMGPIIYGNIGSADRPEFTAIGATVNVAARLEELTKPKALGLPIVVSESVYQALTRAPKANAPRTFDLRGYGAFVVRGLQIRPSRPENGALLTDGISSTV